MTKLPSSLDAASKIEPFDMMTILDLYRLFVDQEKQQIRPVPFKEISSFSQNDITVFCFAMGIYQLPTTELIDWLREEMGDPATVIEVGAGNGCIGRALGIKMYDNMHQDTEEMEMLYALQGQPTVSYGKDVIKMNGNKAVSGFRPKTVISCWVTQKFQQGDDTRKVKIGSSMYGVNELDYIGKIDKYIHCGNWNVHHDKRILSKVFFREYKFPWLISRSQSRDKNCIHVFKFTR